MTITGLGNLAVKVIDLDSACAFYEASGASVTDRMLWGEGERADVHLGPLVITLFTRAIYEDTVAVPDEGFLHPALFTDDLDGDLEGQTVLWGPAVVEGSFGARRIAFVEAPGGTRLELMEQLAPPAASGAARVSRFHHVSVNANGVALLDLVTFYRDVLGLVDRPRPEIPGVPGHWLVVGDQELHLVGAPPAGHGIDPTGHHYCMAVEDLDATIADLDARGIPYLQAVQGADTVQVWITDPAGNTIELQQARSAP